MKHLFTRFNLIAGFPDPYSSANAFMSLPSKALDFLRGLKSLTNVTVELGYIGEAEAAVIVSAGFWAYNGPGSRAWQKAHWRHGVQICRWEYSCRIMEC